MLVFRRLKVLTRLFGSKESEHLKQQFNQLKSLHDSRRTILEEKKQPQPDEKDDLQQKFKDLKEELEQKSGQPKTFTEYLKEDIKQSEPEQDKEEQTKGEAGDSSTHHEPAKSQSLRDRIPGLKPVISISSKCTEFLYESVMETFPSQRYKQKKAAEAYKKHLETLELQRKVETGEINEDDIPEWKRGAVQVVIEKKSSWRKIKDKLSESSAGSRSRLLSERLAKSDQMKAVKAKVDELKDGIEALKEQARERMDESDNLMFQKTREALSNVRSETETAKAIKQIRMADKDFDVYAFEETVQTMVKELLYRFVEDDTTYIDALLSKQAQNIFTGKLPKLKYLKRSELISVVDLTRPVYLGANLEDKGNPRFSYSTKFDLKVLNKGRTERWNDTVLVSVVFNPAANYEVLGHYWQIAALQKATIDGQIGST